MDIYQNKQTYSLHSRQGEGKDRLRKRAPYIYLFISSLEDKAFWSAEMQLLHAP